MPHACGRAVLHARIAQRFDLMLAQGFLEEVRALRALPGMQAVAAPLDLPTVRAVGYRQAWEFLDGQGDARDFRERAIAATRQLAKRQLTWLRGELDARWFDPATDAARLAQALVISATPSSSAEVMPVSSSSRLDIMRA